jgi:hypothetical protein
MCWRNFATNAGLPFDIVPGDASGLLRHLLRNLLDATARPCVPDSYSS